MWSGLYPPIYTIGLESPIRSWKDSLQLPQTQLIILEIVTQCSTTHFSVTQFLKVQICLIVSRFLLVLNSSKLQDLKVVFEDEHIIVVDKPSGVLCVPTKEVSASLSQAVFDAYGCESGNMDSMVVHRLGMDTSGLVVFARTKAAVTAINTLFRTRKVSSFFIEVPLTC